MSERVVLFKRLRTAYFSRSMSDANLEIQKNKKSRTTTFIPKSCHPQMSMTTKKFTNCPQKLAPTWLVLGHKEKETELYLNWLLHCSSLTSDFPAVISQNTDHFLKANAKYKRDFSGLTLTGCQAPTKASLSLPSTTGQRRENIMKTSGF